LATIALVLAPGCQCFTPVDDGPGSDGGSPDGGSPDGGGARDAGPQCTTAADCPAVDPSVTCPFRSPDAGPSATCLERRCIAECTGSRSCTVEDGGTCLRCSTPASLKCAPTSCTPLPNFCAFSLQGCADAGMNGTSWRVSRDSNCRMTVAGDGGALLGTWYDLDPGEAVAFFPALGGWCTGTDLFTGVPRMQWACPACTFVEMGCD
jgi:hypothetical protein